MQSLPANSLADLLQARAAISFDQSWLSAMVTMLAVEGIADVLELHHVYSKDYIAHVWLWVVHCGSCNDGHVELLEFVNTDFRDDALT